MVDAEKNLFLDVKANNFQNPSRLRRRASRKPWPPEKNQPKKILGKMKRYRKNARSCVEVCLICLLPRQMRRLLPNEKLPKL